MYKVMCYNHRSNKDEAVILPETDNDFDSKIEAQNQLLMYAMQRIEETNMKNVSSRPFIFVPKINHNEIGRHYDVAIMARFCNTPDEFMHGYYLKWVDSSDVDVYNRKLRNKYGENITLRLYEDDSSDEPEYYFQGTTTNGESEYFASIEEAYNEACKYMESLY